MNRSVFFASIVLLTTASVGSTQTNLIRSSMEDAAPVSLPIDIQADRLEYRDNNKTLHAIGHVVITHGNDLLKSDRAGFVLRDTNGTILLDGSDGASDLVLDYLATFDEDPAGTSVPDFYRSAGVAAGKNEHIFIKLFYTKNYM